MAGLSLAVLVLGAAESPAPLAQTLAEVDARLAQGEQADLASALGLIAAAEPNATDAPARARLAAASVRVARAACRHHLARELEASFASAQRLLAPKPASDTADPALAALAESAAWVMPPAAAEHWLLQIEPLVWSPAGRAELANSWWTLHDRAGDGDLRRRCQDQAVRLAPASARVQAESAAAGSRSSAAVAFMGFLLALAGLISATRRWRRRREALQARALATLGKLELASAPGGAWVWVACGLISFTVSVLLAEAAWLGGPDFQLRPAVISAGVALVSLVFFHQSTVSMGAHQHGMVVYSLLGTRMLRYTEISRFRYSVTALYRHGVYVNTGYRVSFAADAGGYVTYGEGRRHGQDPQFEWLRDRFSRPIAQRMLVRLRSGQEVPWGGWAWFCPGGVRAGGRTVPYGPGLNGRIVKGRFELFDGGSLVAVLGCDDENFHAGLIVLGAMAGEQAAAA